MEEVLGEQPRKQSQLDQEMNHLIVVDERFPDILERLQITLECLTTKNDRVSEPTAKDQELVPLADAIRNRRKSFEGYLNTLINLIDRIEI